MLMLIAMTFMFVALSIAGQRLAARALRVAGPVRPLAPFVEGTPRARQLAVRVGGAVFTWLVLFALSYVQTSRGLAYTAVLDVAPGMAAASAGLQTGDRVLQVDGQSVNDFGELKTQLTLGGEQKRIVVARGDEQLTFDVTLRDGLLGVKPGAEPIPISRLEAARRAAFMPFLAFRAISFFGGRTTVTPPPERDRTSETWARLIIVTALGWWASVLLEAIAFGINALARRPRASRDR